MKVCTFQDCGRKRVARGYCGGHYKQLTDGRELKPLMRHTPGGRRCTIQDCNQVSACSEGLCSTHLSRKERGNDLEAPIRHKFHTDDLEKRLRHYAPAGSEDECWEWQAARSLDYGVIAIGGGECGRAHVVAWEIANGQSVPEGMLVRHTCDNPPCTNPKHLIIGDHCSNAMDKLSRDRQLRGGRHGVSKLTDDQAREIIAAYRAGGVTQEALAEQYGVSQRTVSLMVRGETWTHLNDGVVANPKKLTREDAERARELHRSGRWTITALADSYGVSRGLMSGIVNGHYYR